ncbi:MAG: murein biosynthesis integral membrane protein MurJ [Thermoanaerobacteraceae bacterium]|nr:murein biosynthesis integral membrane protein MurJ [Thermoanaerobacteraceae bacterium]
MTEKVTARVELGLAHWAMVMTAASMVSRILGFLRNTAISTLFGQNRLTDMLNTSFVIPDTIYLVLVGGGISSAFIPVLSTYLAAKREKEVWEVVSIAFNIVLVLVGLAILFCMSLTPSLVRLVAPGFDDQQVAYTAFLTRIGLISIMFHSLNGVLMGTEYAYQSFIGTVIGPLVYNAAIIIFGIALAQPLGIAAFAVSTLIGAFLNFLVQIWGVGRLKPRYTWSLNFHHPAIRRIGHLMLPVALGLSIAQINLFINQTFIASFLPQGSINALTISSRVVMVPMLFATSIGITLLPALTRLAAQEERETFSSYLVTSLRTIVFLALPATVGLAVLGEPVIRVLFEHGRFTRQDTLLTAGALTYYALGITAYGAYEILARAFYALHDTRTPLKTSLLTLALGTGLNFTLGPLWGVRGLALAYSLAGWFNAFLLYYYLRRRGFVPVDFSAVGRTLARSLGAALVMGVVLKLLAGRISLGWPDFEVVREGLGLLVMIGLGAVLYLGLAWVWRMEELEHLWRILRRRVRRTRPVGGQKTRDV